MPLDFGLYGDVQIEFLDRYGDTFQRKHYIIYKLIHNRYTRDMPNSALMPLNHFNTNPIDNRAKA